MAPTVRMLSNFVNGTWIEGSGQPFRIRNPAHPNVLVAEYGDSTAEEARAAASAAEEAFADWRQMAAEARSEVLVDAAAFLNAHADDVVRDIVQEMGKTVAEATTEVASAVRSLRYFAGQALGPIGEQLPRSSTAQLVWAQRVPLGTVVCITPWNFPLLIPTYKVAAAVAFGNTVVLKPAELTPGSAVWLVKALEAGGVPAGVVNLCLGRGEQAGAALVAERPAAISFTGSNTVGTQIATVVAGTRTRVQLEMGGKNPAVVFDDADLDQATQRILSAAMGMAGQRCTAVSRVIATRGVYGELVSRLAEAVDQIRLGDPLDPTVTMGPVISEAQREGIMAVVRAAEPSARRVAGSADAPYDTDGWFVTPHVFADADRGSVLAQEEIFGPVLTVLPAESADDALEVANATRYGLTATIFTRDLGAALQAVDRIEAGVVHVNRHTFEIERYAPFGGMKDSGHGGREQGGAAKEFFTEVKTVYVSW